MNNILRLHTFDLTNSPFKLCKLRIIMGHHETNAIACYSDLFPVSLAFKFDASNKVIKDGESKLKGRCVIS